MMNNPGVLFEFFGVGWLGRGRCALGFPFGGGALSLTELGIDVAYAAHLAASTDGDGSAVVAHGAGPEAARKALGVAVPR